MVLRSWRKTETSKMRAPGSGCSQRIKRGGIRDSVDPNDKLERASGKKLAEFIIVKEHPHATLRREREERPTCCRLTCGIKDGLKQICRILSVRILVPQERHSSPLFGRDIPYRPSLLGE